MTKQTKTVHKKSRGRPSGRRYAETIPARLEPSTVAAVDAWATSNDVSRSEAIRQLVEIGLKAQKPLAKVTIKSSCTKRAQEMAAQTINGMIDAGAASKERDRRRLRLTMGPPEFRKDRIDQPKSKK
jgi:hypothetical protein